MDPEQRLFILEYRGIQIQWEIGFKIANEEISTLKNFK